MLDQGFVEGKENVRKFPPQTQGVFPFPFLYPQQIPPQILDPNTALNYAHENKNSVTQDIVITHITWAKLQTLV